MNFIDTTQPRTLFSLKYGENQSAIDKHNETAHMKNIYRKLKDKTDSLEIKFIEKLV